MCNRKDEGGRCHAHLTQFIQNLDKREEQVMYDSAVQSGVPLDKDALESATNSVLEQTEKDRADYKATIAQKRANMMALHETAGKELKRSLKAHDEQGGFVANPFSKETEKPKPEDLPGFAGFEDTQGYLNDYKFSNAVLVERKKVAEQRDQAEEAFDKKAEKDALRNNLELRSIKRNLRMAELKEFWNSGGRGVENRNTDELEAEYKKVLQQEVANSGSFDESEEGKQYAERLETLDSEVAYAEAHFEKRHRDLQAYWNKTPAISHNDRGNLPSKLRQMKIHDSGDYARLKGGHYARRFRDAKADYVKAMDSEPKWGAQQDKALKELKKNPPLHQDSFAAYKENVYPDTPEAKEIKSQRNQAQKELVLTPTYRKNLKDKIDHLYYHGHSVEKEQAVLDRLNVAAAAKKAGSPSMKRNKQDETVEEDIAY